MLPRRAKHGVGGSSVGRSGLAHWLSQLWRAMLDSLRLRTLCVVAVVVLGLPSGATPQQGPIWEVCLSPKGGCGDVIVKAIRGARTTVFVQAYSFTSAPIAKALMDAQKRGVRVEVILDKIHRSRTYSVADLLSRSGVPVRIDTAHSIAHNKVIVVDDATVITGPFNFTKAADEQNAENVLVLADPSLAERYRQNWSEHARHSQPYMRPES